MRQVLLSPPQEIKSYMTKGNGKGHGRGSRKGGSASHPYNRSHHLSSSGPKPLVMWMNDDAEIGDTFVWRGEVWVVSAIYGTHLSAAAYCGKCDKPKKRSDAGNGIAVPVDQ